METSAGRKDWPSRLCKRSRSQSKGWASCFSPIQEDLVPSLCSSLDLEGVIFKILTFLPYYKIYQLRTVCKAWNTLLRSPAFLHAWSVAPHEEWVVMARKLPGPWLLSRELVAYDPAADRWMSLQHLLDSCPATALSKLGGPSLGCVANPSLAGNVLFCLSPLAGSSGAPGLICFLNCHFTPSTCPSELASVSHMTQHPRVYSLLVLNLFTGSHRVLPPPLEQFNRFTFCEVEGSNQLVSMQLLPGNNYRVFVQNRHFNTPGPIEIYDSCRGSWKVGRSCDHPGDAKTASAADLSNADLVQFLTVTRIVYAYNVKLDEWSQVFGEFPVSRFRFPKLFRHRGGVFLAAVTHVESFFRGFIVWELRLHHSSPHSAAAPGTPIADWVEVARTPERYWRGFYSADAHSEDKGVRIIFSGGLICMTPVHDTHEGAYNPPPLVYDLVQNSWFHLPYYKGGDNLMAAFSMHPSFTTLA